MATIAIETIAPRHKKVRKLSDSAFRLWVSATCHARDLATDGELVADDLDMVPRCPPAGKKRDSLVRELVNAGLWEVREDGWQIHEYERWNDTREEVEKKRERARARMAKLRGSSREHSENLPRSSERVADGRSNSISISRSEAPDPEGSAEGNQPDAPWPDGEPRATVCPLNLAERLPDVMLAELASAYGVGVSAIKRAVEEFVAYWTVGGGTGKRRALWPRVLRQDIKRKWESGILAKYDAEPAKPDAAALAARDARLAAFKARDDAKRQALIDSAKSASAGQQARAIGIAGLTEGIG